MGLNNRPSTSDDERKILFLWLKQISSYTAWNRVLSYYKLWADSAENCRRMASATGCDDTSRVSNSDYVTILRGLAHCEDGVLRLRSGDKRVFRFDANGDFAMADRALTYWDKYLIRIEWGEHPPISEQDTPGWTDFHRAFLELSEAWGEIAPDVLEPWDANAESHTFYNDNLKSTLQKMAYSPPLPEVPDPENNTFVRSGKTVPCSGIWEPVEVPKAKMLSLFQQKQIPKGPFPIVGTMSYLHADSEAPNMAAYGEERGLPATWRLLWRDARYEDGLLPDEENSYRFLMPETKDKFERITASKDIRDALVWASSGQPAPRAGRWLAENDLNISIITDVGDILPLHQGLPTRWIIETD